MFTEYLPNRLFYQPHRNPQISSALECCKNFLSIALSTQLRTTRLSTILPCPLPDPASKRNKNWREFRWKNLLSGKRPAVPREGECSTPRTPAFTGGERSLGRAESLRRALPLPLPLPPREHTRLIRGPSTDSLLTVGSWSARDLPQLPPRLGPATRRKWRVLEAAGRKWRQRGRRLLILVSSVSSPLSFQRPAEVVGSYCCSSGAAPWGFLRLCSPGWLSTIPAGAGGFLGSGAAWITVRPRATRPRVSFRSPGQCRELSGAAKRTSWADKAPESWRSPYDQGRLPFPGSAQRSLPPSTSLTTLE